MYGGIYGLVKLTSGGAKEEAPAPVVTGELSTEVAIAHHRTNHHPFSRFYSCCLRRRRLYAVLRGRGLECLERDRQQPRSLGGFHGFRLGLIAIRSWPLGLYSVGVQIFCSSRMKARKTQIFTLE